MPAQRSRAHDAPPRHVVPLRRRFPRELVALLVVGVGITAMVVLGTWLVGTEASPAPPARAVPAAAPVDESSVATVALGKRGDVESASIEFQTDERVLHLSVPDPTAMVGGFSPTVHDLRVLTDGRDYASLPTLGAGKAASVLLPAGVATVRIEFSARGTFEATTESRPDRGLALLTPLTIRETQSSTSSIRVTDGRVLNLGCGSGGTMTACGHRDGTAWLTETRGPGTAVVAQLDL